MSEEEKNKSDFANGIKAMAALQKAMAGKEQMFIEQMTKQKQMTDKFVDSMQPFIDQSREMGEIIKRLKGWLDKNS